MGYNTVSARRNCRQRSVLYHLGLLKTFVSCILSYQFQFIKMLLFCLVLIYLIKIFNLCIYCSLRKFYMTNKMASLQEQFSSKVDSDLPFFKNIFKILIFTFTYAACMKVILKT